MGIMDFIKSGTQAMAIARPDNMKHLLVYKHPDQNIPMYGQLTVDSDEVAVFFKDGLEAAVIPPGRHTMHTSNLPILTGFINQFTGGNVFIAEVYFVKTIQLPNVQYGGQIAKMRDPQLACLVTPRIFGSMSIQIINPKDFVTKYHGQGAGQTDNEYVLKFIKDVFMMGVHQIIGNYAIRQKTSFIDIAASTRELAQSFVKDNSPDLEQIGVRIVQMAQFTVNFSDEDQAKLDEANERFYARVQEAQVNVQIAAAQAQANQFQLDQKFQQDARYVQNLAGNWQNYASGSAMIGAGQGMAEHGVGDGSMAAAGVQMAMGANMANQFHQQAQQAPPQFPQPGQPQFAAPAPGGGGAPVTCGKCGAKQPGGKFCAECGGPLAPAKKFCTGCGQETAGKYCANCGQAQA